MSPEVERTEKRLEQQQQKTHTRKAIVSVRDCWWWWWGAGVEGGGTGIGMLSSIRHSTGATGEQ